MKNKTISLFALVSFSFLFFSYPCIVQAETLAKGAPICTTKEYFKEYAQKRNDLSELLLMLSEEKCRCNVTGSMEAEVLEWNRWDMVKVKVLWGEEYFTGWTDTKFVQ